VLKMKTNLLLFVVLLTSIFLLESCNRGQNSGADEDQPTYGTIHISVDESLKPLVDTQITTFEKLYENAHIVVSYKSEDAAVSDLLNDSARIVIVTRGLYPQEAKVFDDQKIIPHKTLVAFDAISVIVNSHNADSLIKQERIIDLLSGKITKWNELVHTSKNNSPIKVIFDNNNSGIVNQLALMLPEKKIANKNCFALKSSTEVLDYVTKHKDALGFVGLSWVSTGDSVTNKFLSTVIVAEIAPLDTAQAAGYHYKPYQANLALKNYPLMRRVYILSREARAGLGTGFSAFAAGDKGQRIVLKSGLLPGTMPIRLVELKKQNLQ
jgi:phosphate transport system substrate-binding protein